MAQFGQSSCQVRVVDIAAGAAQQVAMENQNPHGGCYSSGQLGLMSDRHQLLLNIQFSPGSVSAAPDRLLH
jgi:hypothetical protein